VRRPARAPGPRVAARRPERSTTRSRAKSRTITADDLKPYPGRQTEFLANPAYELGFGGSAGAGKSFCLLLELASEIDDPGYAAIAFRRTFVELEQTLIEESKRIYPLLGGKYDEQKHLWRFPSGARIYFGHLQHVTDIKKYKGPEYGRVVFDELTTFLESQYRFMFTRLRRRDGKPCYMRFGTNPGDIGHAWVLARFAPWLYPQVWAQVLPDGTELACANDTHAEDCPACAPRKPCDAHRPIHRGHEEYSGAQTEEGSKLRAAKGLIPWAAPGEILWVRTREDGTEVYCDRNSHEPACKKGLCKPGAPCNVHRPVSRSFIPARVSDNPTYAGGEYEARLYQSDPLTRAQLLDGDWLARLVAGLLFQKLWFGARLPTSPSDIVLRVRYWDRAATEPSKDNPDPDWTVGVLMGITADGQYIVEDVIRLRGTPGTVKDTIVQTASQDPEGTIVGLELDPAQAGKFEAMEYIRALAGYDVRCVPPHDNKLARAKPVSVQAQAKNIRLVRGTWNAPYLAVLEGFGGTGHDDDVDATSGAFRLVTTEARRLKLLKGGAEATKPKKPGVRTITVEEHDDEDEDDEDAA
jgi:predicted phage terminase large subunit-like protein